MSPPDSREPTTDLRVPAKAAVVERPREDLHPTATLAPVLPNLIAEMVIASRRKQKRMAEDQDQPM
jgi:hypothetical protein